MDHAVFFAHNCFFQSFSTNTWPSRYCFSKNVHFTFCFKQKVYVFWLLPLIVIKNTTHVCNVETSDTAAELPVVGEAMTASRNPQTAADLAMIDASIRIVCRSTSQPRQQLSITARDDVASPTAASASAVKRGFDKE